PAKRTVARSLHARIDKTRFSSGVLEAPTGHEVVAVLVKASAGKWIRKFRIEDRNSISNDEARFANGNAFREIRVVGEQSVAVADAADGWNNLQPQFVGRLLELRHVTEIKVRHTVEDVQLEIGHHNAVVAGVFGPPHDFFGLLDVV